MNWVAKHYFACSSQYNSHSPLYYQPNYRITHLYIDDISSFQSSKLMMSQEPRMIPREVLEKVINTDVSRPSIFRLLPNFPSLSSHVKSMLCRIHDLTSLPWWATISATTILLRLALLPTIVIQGRSIRRASLAINSIRQISLAYVNRLQINPNLSFHQRLSTLAVYSKGMKAALSQHESSVFKIILPTACNIFLFLTFVYGARDLIFTYTPGMATEGCLWFPNLCAMDYYHYLPVSAAVLTYTALDLSVAAQTLPMLKKLIDVFQMLTICGLPVIMNLPAGIFMYWLPSSAFSLLVASVMRTRFAKMWIAKAVNRTQN